MWTYGNIVIIKIFFKKLNDFDIAFSSLNKLSKIKSRINAQRIWKLYFLEKYLKSLDRLI